jgi:hypothetical protein
MRLVLAIVLTVAQLAGPWLCCCGPARVAKAVAGPETKAPPVNDPAHGGCPHCKKEAPTPPPPSDAPAKGPHAPDRCPCGGVLASVVPADKPAVVTADALLVVVSVEPPQAVPLVSVSPPAVAGLRELPHLTTAERLYAHHVLRC